MSNALKLGGVTPLMRRIALLATAAGLLAMPCGVAAQDIAFGDVQSGQLAQGDSVDHRRSFFDCRDFVGRSGQTIQIVMRSIDLDPWVALHRGAGCQDDWIESDNDSGIGFNEARLEITLDGDGVWSFRAGSKAEEDTGDYFVSLAPAGTDIARRLGGDPRPIRFGETVADALSVTDPALAQGRFFDCYIISAEAPSAISMDLHSETFVPQLILFRGEACRTGFVLASEEAVADQREIRVVADLPRAGTYSVRVSTSGREQSGAYRLVLSGTNAP